jgi:hypothetical protein
MKIPTRAAYKFHQRFIEMRQRGYDQISDKGYKKLVLKEKGLKKRVAARKFKSLGKPFQSEKQWNNFIKNFRNR